MADPLPTGDWQQVFALFERWAQAAPDERDAELARIAAEHPLLRPRLEALIRSDHEAQSQGFMEAPAAPTSPIGVSEGTRLGPWALIEPIASGGMGQVWLASRADGLYQGRAAVKCLHSTRRDAAADARFAREGEFLARLSHPHIAQLLDAGITAEGIRYLVLEYVRGERIDQWCDSRALSITDRLRLFVQVCDAVAYAHSHLVVHRDLKPANILVTAEGHVKLLDFGVAKLLVGGHDASELTQMASAGLTPEYASPEQITAAPITTATDVYSLGVLLFGLLSGQRPYGTSASTPAQLARDIVESDPRRLPSAATEAHGAAETAARRGLDPQGLQQALRGDLEHIVDHALQKLPAHRYAGAQALADDIHRHLRHEPVSAQAPSWHYRTAKFIRRHRVAVAAAAMVSLAIVGGAGASLWQAAQAREQAARAQSEAAKATAIKDFLLGVFNIAETGDGQTAEAADTPVRQLLTTSGQQLLADKALPAAVRLELLSTLSSLQLNLNMLEAGDQLALEAVKVAGELHGVDSPQALTASVERALSLRLIGEAGRAESMLAQAVATMDRTGQTTIEPYPVALHELGIAALRRGELDRALNHLRRATAAFEAHAPLHANRSTAHRWLGTTYEQMERFDLAQGQYQRALELAEKMSDLRLYNVGGAQYAMGNGLLSIGRFAQAVPHLQASVDTTAATSGANHPNTWKARVLLARAQHQLGEAGSPASTISAALSVGAGDPSTALGNISDMARLAQAATALDEGDLPTARDGARHLVERYGQSPTPALAARLVLLAECDILAGDPAAALSSVDRALPIIDKRFGADSLPGKHARLVRADALAQASDKIAARAAYQAVLAPAKADAADGSAPIPTLTWLRARAQIGLSLLAMPDNAAGSLQLAQDAAAALGASAVRRDRVALAAARQAESRTLASQGQVAAGRQALQSAVALLEATQAPNSPRLAAARRALAGVPG